MADSDSDDESGPPKQKTLFGGTNSRPSKKVILDINFLRTFLLYILINFFNEKRVYE